MSKIKNKSYTNIVIGTIFSILGYAFTRYIVHDSQSELLKYNPINVIFDFGWFHLNFIEFIYPLFYSLGPFFLSILLIFTFKKTRLLFIEKLSGSSPNIDIIIMFSFIGILLSTIAGSDSDRFILWFFPFFGFIALKSIDFIRDNEAQSATYYSLGIIVLSGLCWSRFYVPAIPKIFFPGDLYQSRAAVKTNYDPSFFYGPSFIQQYQLPLKRILPEDLAYQKSLSDNKEQGVHEASLPMIPYLTERENLPTINAYKGYYKYELNNIPFPLGFSHNQYELLALHPFWGDRKIKLMYIFQWILIYYFLIRLNRQRFVD
jgi:hypothetical protein